jgi:hypothetical protein
MSSYLPPNVQPISETHNLGSGSRHSGSDYEVLTSNPPREYGTEGNISGDEREYSRADLEANNRNNPSTSGEEQRRAEGHQQGQQPQIVYVVPSSQYFPPHRRYGCSFIVGCV